MARDPRKNSAFDSGLRGSDKPKSGGSSGASGGSRHQGAGSKIGKPDGEGSAYSSGMRGSEKAKRPHSAKLSDDNDRANDTTADHAARGGENARVGSSVVGNPEGETIGARGTPGGGVSDGMMQRHTSDAYDMDDNSTERSAAGMAPEAHEDDTHINIRIPKSSIRRGK